MLNSAIISFNHSHPSHRGRNDTDSTKMVKITLDSETVEGPRLMQDDSLGSRIFGIQTPSIPGILLGGS